MILLLISVENIVQAQQSAFQGTWLGQRDEWVDRTAYRIVISGNTWQEFFNNQIEKAGTARFSAGRAELLLADGRLAWDLRLLAPGLIEQPIGLWNGYYRFRLAQSSTNSQNAPLLWYVDEDLINAWKSVLEEIPYPNINFEVKARTEVGIKTNGEDFPKDRFGFIISKHGPQGERISNVPVTVFSDLSRTREYHGWFILALDPWMLFRKHDAPEPDRSFLNNNVQGSILLAGLDNNAVKAWLCQLLQQTPGVFNNNPTFWEEKKRTIANDYPFQADALTYSWVQVLPLLFNSNAPVVYAPLSQVRNLSPFRSALLNAYRFPEPKEWGNYGLQADLLWSKRMGNDNNLKEITDIENWLKNPRTQTIIANTIKWLPAHPSGSPYNTNSFQTQMIWLKSSFIWQ